MVDYKWSFGPADVQDEGILKDVVKTLTWTLTAYEGERLCRQTGRLALPETDPYTFIPFEKLSHDVVAKWVTANPAMNVPYIEATLKAQFELPSPPPPMEVLNFPFNP